MIWSILFIYWPKLTNKEYLENLDIFFFCFLFVSFYQCSLLSFIIIFSLLSQHSLSYFITIIFRPFYFITIFPLF